MKREAEAAAAKENAASSFLRFFPLSLAVDKSEKKTHSLSIDKRRKKEEVMADVLARLEDGSFTAIDRGLLAEKIESAVSLLDRTLDLYG